LAFLLAVSLAAVQSARDIQTTIQPRPKRLQYIGTENEKAVNKSQHPQGLPRPLARPRLAWVIALSILCFAPEEMVGEHSSKDEMKKNVVKIKKEI